MSSSPPSYSNQYPVFYRVRFWVRSESVMEILLTQLSHILSLPAFGFNVVAEHSIDVFHGQNIVSHKRTKDVWRREERVPVSKHEVDEEVVRRTEFVRDEEVCLQLIG